MDGFAVLDDLARCVMLYVVADRGLGGRGRRTIPDADAGKQKGSERNEEDASRNDTTFHKVSIAVTIKVLNPTDCCPFPDCPAQNLVIPYSPQFLPPSYRHRLLPQNGAGRS